MTAIARPTFSDGQYVAAADLEAILAYARALKTAHDLGSHSWGVTTGLDLIERPGLGGTTECWVTSGHAVDGLGRSLILRSAQPVGASLLQTLPSGAWFVWVGQRARSQNQIRPAYGVCNDVDAFARIAEEVEILVTGALPLADRQSGVDVAGTVRPDARLSRRLFDPDGPFQLDGSVPEQAEHPLGLRARWLVPIGLVGWDQAQKQIRPLSDAEKKGARLFRRQAGAVAEEILAPGGLLRLRDRNSFVAAGQPDSAVETAAAALAASAADLDIADGRVRFQELLWVDGHSRMKGDVRLFAGQIEWRDGQGASPQGPVFMRRISTPAGDGELLLSVGAKADKSPMSRLVAGPLDGQDTLPALCVGSDMRVGIGTRNPVLPLDIRGDFGALSGPVTAHFGSATVTGAADGQLTLRSGNNVVQIGEKDHRVGINVVPAPANALHVVGTVQVDGTGKLRLLGSEFIDAGDGILRIRSGGGIVAFDGSDSIGIGTTAPGYNLDVAGNARVTGTIRCFTVLSLSDRRLKRAIQPIEKPLDLALSLRGVSFRWNEKAVPAAPEAAHFGFVADEVEKVLPDLVEAGPDGTKYVRSGDIGALLLEALRVLNGKLDAAIQENRRLADRIARLEGAGMKPQTKRGRREAGAAGD